MGTLKMGDPFICGDYGGKVKSLMDDRGKPMKEAGPSTPVKVLGFSGLPQAGDEFLVMESERSAKTLSEERLLDRRADKLSAPQRATLESLLEAADGKKHLRIVLKCDAQGSLEALTRRLESDREQEDRSRNHPRRRGTDFENQTFCWPAPPMRWWSVSTSRLKAWP